jgi:hypothetical protein
VAEWISPGGCSLMTKAPRSEEPASRNNCSQRGSFREELHCSDRHVFLLIKSGRRANRWGRGAIGKPSDRKSGCQVPARTVRRVRIHWSGRLNRPPPRCARHLPHDGEGTTTRAPPGRGEVRSRSRSYAVCLSGRS